MWFSLFSSVLILAITFHQGLQGLFTAMITCILTVLSAALAFGFYEDLYFAVLADRQPDHGRALTLIAIFVITLLVLRTIYDKLITGNLRFHVYVDRAGGGVFGMVTALIIVGMLNIGFLMLPFGAKFLGFSRFEVVDKDTNKPVGENLTAIDWSKVKQVRQKTWLNAGGFTTSLVSHLSQGALRGREDVSFGEIYPDFVDTAHQAKTNPLTKSRLTVPADVLRIVGYWDLRPNEFFTREIVDGKDGKRMVQLKPAPAPDPGIKRWLIRVTIDAKGADDGGTYRFTPEQFRLLARDRSNGPIKVYFLAGINDDNPVARGRLVEAYPGEGFSRKTEDGSQLDLVFLVPEQAEFRPLFLEYKQNARAEILPSQDKNKQPRKPLLGPKPPAGSGPPGLPPSDQSSSPQGSAPPTVSPESYGRVAVLGPAQGFTVSDALPWPEITNYGGVHDAPNGVIKGARQLTIDLDENWQPRPGNQTPLKRFDVPSDMRLLQVSVERLHAGSTYGQALQFAVQSISDFYLKAEGDKSIQPAGVYAMAKVGGQPTFELIYLDETERGVAHLPPFDRIHPPDFKDQYALVYLFLVPPGTKPLAIHTGRRDVDLRSYNLVVK